MNEVSSEPEIGPSYKLMAGLKAMTSKDRSQIVPDLPIDIPCPPCKPPKQPDALARLEAWLRGGDRSVYFGNEITSGLEVILRDSAAGEEYCGVEHPPGPGQKYAGDVAIAKSPGIAATILAALEKAKEVKL